MEKNCIDRKALRYNFLKKIIIRFDYDGMDDTELDQVISSISIELKKHDYTSRTVEMEKEMQFEFNDPESGDYAELYGIVVAEKIKDIENPKTGDNIGVYLVTSLIAVIGLLTIYRKKQIN